VTGASNHANVESVFWGGLKPPIGCFLHRHSEVRLRLVVEYTLPKELLK